MTIDDYAAAVPVHRIAPDTCPECGDPVQHAEDHACGECAAHCTLERHRRALAAARAAQQAADDARIAEIHARRVRHAA